MGSIKFQGSISHSEESIQEMFKMQYYTYSKIQILLKLLAGIVLIFIGLFAPMPTWGRAVLLLAGCFLIALRDLSSQLRADRTMETRNGRLPKMKYTFYADEFKLSGEGQMTLSYDKIDRLAEDENYLYIFLARDSVCMLKKDTIQPNSDDFKTFLEERSKKMWKKEKSLLFLNVWDIWDMLRMKKDR